MVEVEPPKELLVLLRILLVRGEVVQQIGLNEAAGLEIVANFLPVGRRPPWWEAVLVTGSVAHDVDFLDDAVG